MALAAPRDTKQKAIEPVPRPAGSFPMNGGSKVWQGGLVGLNAEGNLIPMGAALGLKCLGRAEETVDNTTGDDADLSCNVKPGCFRWDNSSAGEALTKAEVGTVCYAVNDLKVGKTSASDTLSPAGIVIAVDSDGVWVLSGIPESELASLDYRMALLEARVTALETP